ncbi:MAG TPA: ABC transporter permease [Terriglobales bacterium]
MRNTWLIIRREYLERVRTKSFIVSTLLLPALMIALMVLPSKLATLKASGTKRLAVVCANPDFARAVQSQLEAGKIETDKLDTSPRYKVEIVSTPDEATRAALKGRIGAGTLDGYVWLSDDALASRKISYVARETSDFIEAATLQSALKTALLRQELRSRGVAAEDADKLMKGVDLDTVSIKGGQEKKGGGPLQFLSAIVLVMMLYMTLILYGVAVMRSVLEEKTSRVMEVVLSSATAKELMAGKILGVGAVALTQIALWVVIGLGATTPGLLAARNQLSEINLSPAALPAFAVFFVLGFLLYSALYAALGAMVNSEQEAQQWQFLVVMPIIIPIVMMTYVIRQPNAPLSMWMSLVPFFAPILMYIRVVVQMPPLWQIGVCIALLLLTLWGVVTLCSRIYRVGILMYGKKPTLPEIVKWIRYA